MFSKEKKEKQEKRFVIKEQQALGLGALTIVADSQTGVNYIVAMDSSPTYITPLLDSDGRIVIDK